LRDKQQFLCGILLWRLNADYKARLQLARQQLAELDALSTESRVAMDKLQQANLDIPDKFGDFSRRIQQQQDKLRQLQSRTTSTRSAQGAMIEKLAVTELQQQLLRLESYIVQARFALAQTHDDALQGNSGATP
jgi:chromosome segregation ATPase